MTVQCRLDAENNVGGEMILLVEDEWLLRATVGEFLRDCDYKVVEAANADDAVAMLRDGLRADLVITDVKMPGRLDGVGLTGWIAQNRPHIPVVLASGTVRLAINAGSRQHVCRMLDKPYNFAMLERTILDVLRDSAEGIARLSTAAQAQALD